MRATVTIYCPSCKQSMEVPITPSGQIIMPTRCEHCGYPENDHLAIAAYSQPTI